MALILHIDTATDHAGICLSNGEEISGLMESTDQKNHASFLQPAIARLMADNGYSLNQLDAVSVSSGPGSYTGLRVGLASAKGICFALNKPLLMIPTLKVMAKSMLEHLSAVGTVPAAAALLCPMIDARRMEVFTAIYNLDLKEITGPHALVIDAQSFNEKLYPQPIFFSGSGHHKLKGVIKNSAANFLDVRHHAGHLARLATDAFILKQFADLAYSEPLYVKAFFDTSKNIK